MRSLLMLRAVVALALLATVVWLGYQTAVAPATHQAWWVTLFGIAAAILAPLGIISLQVSSGFRRMKRYDGLPRQGIWNDGLLKQIRWSKRSKHFVLSGNALIRS
jgi:hypothetical protein